MYTEINFNQFAEEFRSIRPNNFSYAGLGALFGYLEELEEDLEERIELDVIGLCCDYTEYANIEEFLEEYGDSYGDYTIKSLEDDTTVIYINNSTGFIIHNF